MSKKSGYGGMQVGVPGGAQGGSTGGQQGMGGGGRQLGSNDKPSTDRPNTKPYALHDTGADPKNAEEDKKIRGAYQGTNDKEG